MDEVEDLGGAVAAIEEGFQKSEIERSAYRHRARRSTDGERVVVGLNRFRVDDEEPYEPLRVDPAIEAEQAERLATLRAERDGDEVTPASRRRCAAAGRRATDNVLYPMREALRGPGHRRRGLQRPARRLGRLPPARRLLSVAGGRKSRSVTAAA